MQLRKYLPRGTYAKTCQNVFDLLFSSGTENILDEMCIRLQHKRRSLSVNPASGGSLQLKITCTWASDDVDFHLTAEGARSFAKTRNRQ